MPGDTIRPLSAIDELLSARRSENAELRMVLGMAEDISALRRDIAELRQALTPPPASLILTGPTVAAEWLRLQA